MNNLNKELKDMAVGYGLCRQWQSEWEHDYSKEELIEKFFDGIDFCIQHDYPGNSYIKENFDRDILRKKGVLVDDNYSLLNPQNAAIFGNSSTTIRYNMRHNGRIWCKDNAKVKVIASNNAFVIVHAFDNVMVEAFGKDMSKIVVIRHSNACDTHGNGNLVIKEEFNMFK